MSDTSRPTPPKATERIGIGEGKWTSTLPHVVTPRPNADESLIGLMLRSDEKNGWPSGTTCGFQPSPAGLSMNSLVLPSLTWGEELATVMGITLDDVQAATYTRELAALFAERPRHIQARPQSKTSPFSICPQCFADDHLIRRAFSLHGVTECPVHQVGLLKLCTCYSKLEPFPSGTITSVSGRRPLFKPFTCRGCGRPWDHLLGELESTVVMPGQRHVYSLYAEFIANPSAMLLDRALSLLDHAPSEKNGWTQDWPQVYRVSTTPYPAIRQDRSSPVVLAQIVKALVHDGFIAPCLTSNYFPTCRNRYVLLNPHTRLIAMNPASAIGQACQCGNQDWSKRLSPVRDCWSESLVH